MKRIMFLGQKKLGEKCFEYLLNNHSKEFEIISAVSNKCENVWWRSNEIFDKTRNTNIHFIDNEKQNEDDIYKCILHNKINTIISVQHSWILSEKILKAVDGNAFNLHNAKLPKYKGNNIFTHIILNGEKRHTSTIHFMHKQVDMGDILLEKSISIDENDTSKSLYEKAQKNAENLFELFIKKLKTKNKFSGLLIKDEGFFYKRDSLIGLREIKNLSDFNEVDKKSRAFFFNPFEPAFFIINERKFYVLPESSYIKKVT